MNLKKLLGMIVLDNKAKEIGKIRDVDFDESTGKITGITVSLKKNILSTDETSIDYGTVKSIGDYVLVDISAEEVRATIIEDEEADVEDENVEIIE